METSRGTINPVLARLNRRRAYDIGRTLVVAGFPRSGTTWLAEIIATVPGTGIVFEPLDFRAVKAAQRAGCDWENFHAPGEDWPEGHQFLNDVLSGRVLNRWTASHLPCTRVLGLSRWIVKFVRANQMLGWLVSRFDIPPPVLLIRHPCAVYASWVARGWPLLTYPPPPDLKFFAAYPQFRSVVESLEAPEEYFAVQWCMRHYTAFDQLQPAQYQLCFYEHLVSDPMAEIRSILARWELPEPAQLEAAIGRPSAKASPELDISSEQQLSGWHRRLDPDVVSRMLCVVDAFGLDFYGRGPLPEQENVAAFVSSRDSRGGDAAITR